MTSATDLLTYGLLQLMAANYNFRPNLRAMLHSVDGPMDFSVGVATRSGDVGQTIRFRGGRAVVSPYVAKGVDTLMVYRDASVIRRMLRLPPEEILNLLLKNELTFDGNLSVMSKFNYLLSKLLPGAAKKNGNGESATATNRDENKSAPARRAKLRVARADAVEFLDNPFLTDYSLADFPRLQKFLEIHHTKKPEICHERPALLTEWFRENGFETDRDGEPRVPELRQAAALRHLLANRKPIIRRDDLVAGTTTTREIGVVIYPDTSGTMIWGELGSVPHRQLNPYDISEESQTALHRDIFPYWEKRNMREWVRERYDAPTSQKIDERFAVYFLWKTAALSHTIPDFPKLLGMGVSGMIDELRRERDAFPGDPAKADTVDAMILSLEGLELYADNLQKQAEREAAEEAEPQRAAELRRLAEILSRVPRHPAQTLDEAVNAVWIAWVALHMENTNAGLSLGRLDQWLQPYFAADIRKLDDPAAREQYIKKAVELIGCFYMRCTDHLPLVPDIGNFLFGGSSSDQAITLGGVAPDGTSAVNDMTYIFLKVTEMLAIRDPNVNARHYPGVNSDDYLRRLCEVNLITAATPSMHNDIAVMDSLAEFNYPVEHLRDWSATGCVEPTLSGRHIGHTNCMMMNMVAAVEMALNNGRHPLMDWKIGPDTGDDFPDFESFYNAFAAQYKFLIDSACDYNNMLAEAHSVIRPTPLLSAFIDGCRQSGRDVTRGGALYNTSGAAIIGLADVTDSLMAIKKLVFDDRRFTFKQLQGAVADNFAGHKELHTILKTDSPRFGSGNPEALEMAKRVARFTHDAYGARVNFRGGRYTSGFWSMSNHVAFGCLAGALPSGRLAGKPFTPGLTPAPDASDTLLDPIQDVASLPPRYMNNNIAFNVKVVPAPGESHERAVEHIFNYAKTYFDLGGMQMQFNVVSSDTLRDAMAHPENHRDLLVRISGYNAYFTTLNHDMQMELIERAEYGTGS